MEEDPDVVMSDLNLRLTNLQTKSETTSSETTEELGDETVEVDENFARRNSLRVRRKATNMSSKGYWNLVQQNMGDEDGNANQRRGTYSTLCAGLGTVLTRVISDDQQCRTDRAHARRVD
jgi:hypothetical protein